MEGWFHIKKNMISFQNTLGILGRRNDRSGPPTEPGRCCHPPRLPASSQSLHPLKTRKLFLQRTPHKPSEIPQLSTFTPCSPSAPVSRALAGSVQLRAIFSYSKTSKTNQKKRRGRGSGGQTPPLVHWPQLVKNQGHSTLSRKALFTSS